jgi:transcriptional regulator of acetoin/glycerol metabolism
MDEIMDKTRSLRAVACPHMERMLQFVQESGLVVVLTDEESCVVAINGNPETLKEVRAMGFQIGSVWAENEVGTNAIGTTALLKQAIQISGTEHYSAKFHRWTCSAAPILQDNTLKGILGIFGPSSSLHSHTLGMVVAAAQAIEIHLQKEEQYRRQFVLHSQLNGVFEALAEGVIVLDKNGYVQQANLAARQILNSSPADIVGSDALELIHDHREEIKRLLEQGQECEFEFIPDNRQSSSHATGIGKPIIDREKQVIGATIILRPIAQVRQLVARMTGAKARFTFDSIIGQEPSLKNVIKLAKIASRTSSNVLMQGESGTGKEVFAQAIHNGSSRRNGPFVAVNCAALPRELVGSELFGYDEGAFTGAKREGRPGKFELANGGTLLLDEIGDMPLEQQATLLRAIQEKAIMRVGGDKLIRVNVRIIAATNRDLLGLVAEGRFRQDLYYRLNVMQVAIPPLRDRRGDIPVLFRYFLDDMCKKMGKDINHVDDEVIKCLCAYNWPGNVRELQNVAERTSLMVEDGHVTVSHLPQEVTCPNRESRSDGWEWGPRSVISVAHESLARENRKRAMEQREKERIIHALDDNGGNVTRTAAVLGISRNTLYRKLKKYGIQN